MEASVDADQNLDVTDPSVLFDLYLNTCPAQGSRTIRTEVRAYYATYLLNHKALFGFNLPVLLTNVGQCVNLVFPIFFSTGGHLSFYGRAETEDHCCLFRCFQLFIKELVMEESKQRHAGRHLITMKLFIFHNWTFLTLLTVKTACTSNITSVQ